jgi:hypothetical protein
MFEPSCSNLLYVCLHCFCFLRFAATYRTLKRFTRRARALLLMLNTRASKSLDQFNGTDTAPCMFAEQFQVYS